MRIATLAVMLTFIAACGGSGDEDGAASGGMGMGGMMQHSTAGDVDTTGLRGLAVPAEHTRGRELYEASCSSCHGEAGLGTATGPPLIHIIYEPNHHSDAAFILASERGVRAHHWGFGDMPPQPMISRPEVAEVTAYIRWLQREAGVY